MNKLTPIKAIRLKCMDCSNFQNKEIRLCPITNCPLYPYRMGKRPKEDTIENKMLHNWQSIDPFFKELSKRV